jgi:DNA-binding MarR family transcriptional regulator
MPLDEPRLQAWRAVRDAHATLTGSVEEALRDADLPPLSWFNLLWALDEAPDKRLRMNQLAAYLNLSRGGLTKLVDRLEGAALITRQACPADRRGYHAVLEPTGEEMLHRMWPVYEAEVERHFAAGLSIEEAATIRDVLGRAAESACTLAEGPAPEPAPVGVSSNT